jgi:hypothetical protein
VLLPLHGLQLDPELCDPISNASAVHLERCFAGEIYAILTATANVLTQARRKVAKPRNLDLQPRFTGPGMSAKDFYNDTRSIKNSGTEVLFEVCKLRRGKLAIKYSAMDHRIRISSLAEFSKLSELSLSEYHTPQLGTPLRESPNSFKTQCGNQSLQLIQRRKILIIARFTQRNAHKYTTRDCILGQLGNAAPNRPAFVLYAAHRHYPQLNLFELRLY